MTAAKKTTPPPLSLPERPPSKVEAGLAAEAEPTFAEKDAALAAKALAEHNSPEARQQRAIAAMVEAGLSQEFAEAAFVLREENATAADVTEAVDEISTAPLCEHGCHGVSWADVDRKLDAVSCEHGAFARNPE